MGLPRRSTWRPLAPDCLYTGVEMVTGGDISQTHVSGTTGRWLPPVMMCWG